MRDLTANEVDQVNGGIVPAVYGAVVGAARLASSPAVRSAVSSGTKWVADRAAGGVVGGATYAAATRDYG